jgi:hypothetical protein
MHTYFTRLLVLSTMPQETASPPSVQWVFADAHVHIYDCFNLDHFLDAAYSNFAKAAIARGVDQPFQGVLLLTETICDRYFEFLHKRASGQAINQQTAVWQFSLTQEEESLKAHTADGRELYLIAGRQIVTAEDLEVLALGTAQHFEDGQPIQTVVTAVQQSGGLPVIPWGFGKWIGRRGDILNHLLQSQPTQLFLGDNSGRPAFWKRPPFFQAIEQQGSRVLPGTDPLPFSAEATRPGKFGCCMQIPFNPQHPATSIKQALLDRDVQCQSYGTLERPTQFVRNQLTMQVMKRQRRSA